MSSGRFGMATTGGRRWHALLSGALCRWRRWQRPQQNHHALVLDVDFEAELVVFILIEGAGAEFIPPLLELRERALHFGFIARRGNLLDPAIEAHEFGVQCLER